LVVKEGLKVIFSFSHGSKGVYSRSTFWHTCMHHTLFDNLWRSFESCRVAAEHYCTRCHDIHRRNC